MREWGGGERSKGKNKGLKERFRGENIR